MCRQTSGVGWCLKSLIAVEIFDIKKTIQGNQCGTNPCVLYNAIGSYTHVAYLFIYTYIYIYIIMHNYAYIYIYVCKTIVYTVYVYINIHTLIYTLVFSTLENINWSKFCTISGELGGSPHLVSGLWPQW